MKDKACHVAFRGLLGLLIRETYPSFMKDYLIKNKIIDPQFVELLSERVRDRTDVKVWRCQKSGVIFLETPAEDSHQYYQTKKTDANPHLCQTSSVEKPHQTLWQEDDLRRAQDFNDLIRGKRWLDFGAGEGRLLRLLGPKASEAWGIELNESQKNRMQQHGVKQFDSLEQVPDLSLDVISLFHVLEHLQSPVETLQTLLKKLVPGGSLIVEVPHSQDFLIKFLDCQAFRDFSFWSEHLILHTRNSLETFLSLAGAKSISTTGFQRYGLANHLYWLRHQRPGGHGEWGHIETAETTKAYSAMLNRLDQNDTLISISKK